MNILVVGDHDSLQECQDKWGSRFHYIHALNHEDAKRSLHQTDFVFDFIIDLFPQQVTLYDEIAATVFLNTVKISLAELMLFGVEPIRGNIFGFNGIPTMLNRELLEVSVLKEEEKENLSKACAQLETKYAVVDDRVGMATPRVICMIINEAYYTLMEGTASRSDIDLAMKLGTNYPFGPFEWCDRIGVQHVFEVLEAVYEDTRDERYRICPLLKKEYLARRP